MKFVNTSFAILKTNDPLWNYYIKWLNYTYDEGYDGRHYHYYGFNHTTGKCFNLQIVPNHIKILNLSQWLDTVKASSAFVGFLILKKYRETIKNNFNISYPDDNIFVYKSNLYNLILSLDAIDVWCVPVFTNAKYSAVKIGNHNVFFKDSTVMVDGTPIHKDTFIKLYALKVYDTIVTGVKISGIFFTDFEIDEIAKHYM